MLINTITCHHAYNYGATLQAYALQQYLEQQGNEVTIIRFEPPYYSFYDWRVLDKGSRPYNLAKKIPVLTPLLRLRKFFLTRRVIGRKYAFDSFDKEYLHLSQTVYHSSAEIKSEPPVAELYIAGSDQIWNTNMMNGSEGAYYLDFGARETIRASYAASFGVSEIKPELKRFVKDKLSKLNFISVREKTALSILEDLGITTGVCVLDPVFLLNREKWCEIASKAKKQNLPDNYILLYDLKSEKDIVSFVQNYSFMHNLPIVSINDTYVSKYADYNVNDAGPAEFINLILNASVVIANSFHATAFSLILNKEFYVFPLSKYNNSSRMIDLLSEFGCVERFNPIGISSCKLDYNEINKRIVKAVCESNQYLKKIISCN